MNLSDNELNLIRVALKDYYEVMINQQHELAARINQLSTLNDEILSLEMNPIAQTMEIKAQIILDIKTLWSKLNSDLLQVEEEH